MNAIIGIVTDISQRKQAEEALRQSEEKYRSLVNNLNIGIYRSTGLVSGRFLEANPAMAEMFGYDSIEKFKNVAVSMFYQDPEDRKRFTEKIKKEGLVKNEELRLQKKDGAPIWASCTARVQHNANGEIKWIDGVIEDITGRKQAEEELKQTMAGLARSNKELEQFAYMVSHDLKQPLTTVLNLIELLKLRYQDKLDTKANNFITSALNEADRMHNMIEDILALSRVGTRGKPFEPVDCEDMLARILVHLKMRIKESGAIITHDPLPTVMADEAQLVRLFQNLLGNALKFRGEEPPRIHISAKSIPHSAFRIPHSAIEKGWLFSVSDNGIGIDPQFKERIFVIFERLHTKEEYPGTGIGLAICKKIVERHGGRIWVESEPGKGATFYFTFPNEGVKY